MHGEDGSGPLAQPEVEIKQRPALQFFQQRAMPRLDTPVGTDDITINASEFLENEKIEKMIFNQNLKTTI